MSDKAPEKTMPVAKIIIGYKTRLVAGVDKITPEFKANAGYKDAAKIQADIEEKKAAYLAGAKDMPYTGTFDEVFIVDGTHEKIVLYRYDETKAPISVRVMTFLNKYYPNGWLDDTHGRKQPEAIFVGFDPRTFLKILGLECSMPAINKRAPLGMWYTNADHRDIGEAMLPKEFKGLSYAQVLKLRRPVVPAEAKKWDDLTEGWAGPGANAEKDALIAVEIASQLGILKE